MRGDSCPYAHNVFEYWLHPTRYRTQLCNDMEKCNRKVSLSLIARHHQAALGRPMTQRISSLIIHPLHDRDLGYAAQ